jgi:tetratricopeptide (TPR) repeat protein
MSRPKRSRSHELETESRRAFDSALPTWLVSRPQPDDYGVDLEVELFEAGLATGLTFKVQLKATDARGRVKERIRRSSILYWHDLDVPVLIVLYNSVDQSLRYRWVHSIGSDAPDSGANKITLNFDINPPIDAEWFDDLPSSLRLLRDLRRGVVPRPLPVRPSISEDSESSFNAARWGTELLKIAGREALRVAPSDEPAVTVELSHTVLRVRFPLDFSTATFDFAELQDNSVALESLAQTSLILIAAVVANVDPARGGVLAAAASVDTPVWLTQPIASRLAPALFESGNLTKLFELASRFSAIDDSQARGVAEIYHLFMLSNISSIAEEDFDHFFANSIAAIESEGSRDPQSAGHRMYNLGHMHLARNEFERALERFDRAAQFEARYASDAEFNRSVARAAFGAGQFLRAAENYELFISNAIVGVNDVIPLAADALMYAGEFARAESVMATWIPGVGEVPRVGWLRGPMLEVIRVELGVASQIRNVATAEQIAASVGDSARILEMLRLTDALDPRLWIALCDDAESVARYFGGLLIVAEMMKDLPQAWGLSLVSSLLREEDESIVASIIDGGLLFCGKEFISMVEDFASGQSEENSEALLNLLSARYNSEPPRYGTKIRFLSDSPDAWAVDEYMMMWE